MIELNRGEQLWLLALARDCIQARLHGRQHHAVSAAAALNQPAGAFVSLHAAGQLRGCIGRLAADDNLSQVVATMAVAAAFEDPRFPPLRGRELADIDLEISVLSPLWPASIDRIEPGKHGVLLQYRGRSGVFLPQVAVEQAWDRDELLENLCYKAGVLPWSHLQPEARLLLFTAQVFSEHTS